MQVLVDNEITMITYADVYFFLDQRKPVAHQVGRFSSHFFLDEYLIQN